MERRINLIEVMIAVKAIRNLFVALLISFMCMNLTARVFSAPQQFSAEGEYRLGDHDTREDAKKFAVADAKRKIVEQAGVYVESFTEVNNFRFIQDKINIIAQAVIMIKSERTEFSENGVLCKAYVTGVIDMNSVEKKLRDIIREGEKREVERKKAERLAAKDNYNKPISVGKSIVGDNCLRTKKEVQDIIEVPKDLSGDLAELEEARIKMVEDLSKATAYTAGSEYKLQEVTGIRDGGGFHDEKGEISNYLKENFEMTKNYRFAELTPFVELAGAEKIIQILEEVNKEKNLDAKDTMTFAKIERTRAKNYGDVVLKEAAEIFNRAEKLMVDANDAQMNRLKIIRHEADDAIKLIRALEARNKDVDEVAKKYEKANKITAKNDKGNSRSKGSKKIQDFLDNLFKNL